MLAVVVVVVFQYSLVGRLISTYTGQDRTGQDIS